MSQLAHLALIEICCNVVTLYVTFTGADHDRGHEAGDGGEMEDGSGKGGDRALALFPGPAASRRDWSLPLHTAGGWRPLIGQRLDIADSDWLAGPEAGASWVWLTSVTASRQAILPLWQGGANFGSDKRQRNYNFMGTALKQAISNMINGLFDPKLLLLDK